MIYSSIDNAIVARAKVQRTLFVEFSSTKMSKSKKRLAGVGTANLIPPFNATLRGLNQLANKNSCGCRLKGLVYQQLIADGGG